MHNFHPKRLDSANIQLGLVILEGPLDEMVPNFGNRLLVYMAVIRSFRVTLVHRVHVNHIHWICLSANNSSDRTKCSSILVCHSRRCMNYNWFRQFHHPVFRRRLNCTGTRMLYSSKRMMDLTALCNNRIEI